MPLTFPLRLCKFYRSSASFSARRKATAARQRRRRRCHRSDVSYRRFSTDDELIADRARTTFSLRRYGRRRDTRLSQESVATSESSAEGARRNLSYFLMAPKGFHISRIQAPPCLIFALKARLATGHRRSRAISTFRLRRLIAAETRCISLASTVEDD